MGSLRRIVGLLVFGALAGASILAADSSWGDYLDGSRGERLEAAIAAVEDAEADLDSDTTEQLRQMEEIYVEVRVNELPPQAARAEYSRVAIGRAAIDRAAPNRDVTERSRDAALDTIHQILRSDPPRFGSDQWHAAIEWLTDRAEARFLPVGEVAGFAAAVLIGVEGASDREIGAFIDQIVPDAQQTLPEFDVESRLGVAMDLWLLRLFSHSEIALMAADLTTQSDALDGMSDIAAESADRLAELFLQFDDVADTGNSSANLLAFLGPTLFVDPDAMSDEAPQTLASFVRSQLGLERTTRVFLAGSDPTSRFAMRMTAHLLGAMSDYEHYLLARRLGVSRRDLVSLSELLYLAENDVMGRDLGAIEEIERRFAAGEDEDSVTPTAEFERYIEEGDDAVDRLSEWSGGRATRTGDEYRWAVLSVLSNRYAQYRILTEESLGADRKLVADYVDEVYSGLPESQTADRAIPTFDRLIITDAPGEVCANFLRRAQGIEALPPGMEQELADGVTLASLWCHTHGLQPMDTDAANAEDTIVERAGRWIDLANAAMSRAEKYAHRVRLSFALSDAVSSALAYPIARTDASYLRRVSPRIFAMVQMAEQLATLEVAPEWFLAAVADLMEQEEADLHQVVATAAVEVANIARTISEVYGGDLSVMRRIREATQ